MFVWVFCVEVGVGWLLFFGLCFGLCLVVCLCFFVCLVVGFGGLFHFYVVCLGLWV